MSGIREKLGVCLLYFDGGMGTLLQSMGLAGGERPERWNLLHPERIEQVHLGYLDAGSDIITTNTFGAAQSHLGDDAASCMRAGRSNRPAGDGEGGARICRGGHGAAGPTARALWRSAL